MQHAGPFNTTRILSRRSTRITDDAFLWQWLGHVLLERLPAINRNFKNMAILAPTDEFMARARETRPDWTFSAVSQMPEPSSCDAFIMLGLPSITNDVPKLLLQAQSALQDNGLFMAAFFGGHSWAQLRTSLLQAESATHSSAALRVAPMLDASTSANLLQRAGFALPVVDFENAQLTYTDLQGVVRDLRAANMQAVLEKTTPLTRSAWCAAENFYKTHFTDARGRLICDLQGLFLSGWRS